MEGIEINGKIDLGVRRLIVAHVENAITFYGYMVSFTRLKLFSIIDMDRQSLFCGALVVLHFSIQKFN